MQEALLYRNLADSNNVQCFLCSHYCNIKPGEKGTCKLRKNVDGKLYTSTYGDISGMAIDPVEKKPLYHFYPASKVLSFGAKGCNFFCTMCQNWQLSQTRDGEFDSEPKQFSKLISDLYIQFGYDSIAYTYSEPTIFFEYARDIIRYCKSDEKLSALKHIFVSNGYFSKEMLDVIDNQGLVDAMNIDLKFIHDSLYKRICGASLLPVLDNIRQLWNMRDKIHIEITNLIIPELNDSDKDIDLLCQFIASVSKDIPVHFSRFFPQYKLSEKSPTSPQTLLNAKTIADRNGLNYVYIGNSSLTDVSDTYCPECHTLLISRRYYEIIGMYLTSDHCPKCNHRINIKL